MHDLWFYGILNFLKKGRASSNFRKIRAIVLKLHTNILHPSRNFGIEFGQNRLKRSNFIQIFNFLRIFSKLSNSGKFRFIELKFCVENFVNRWSPLNFRRIWFFYFFLIVTSNYKNLMYPRSFRCEEAKIKQRTPLKKELCEIGEETIWESWFTSF